MFEEKTGKRVSFQGNLIHKNGSEIFELHKNALNMEQVPEVI